MSVTMEPVVLEGRHVRLEPMGLEHADALSAVGLDEELWRWTYANVATPEQMRAYVEEALRWWAAGHSLPFVTVERATARVIGSTRYHSLERTHGRVEIGWTWVARPWQRTPVNTEAKYLMLCHAFERLGLRRVEFKTDRLNEKSRAALARIGATQEGIFRSHMVTASGRVRDSVYFSIIAEEWPRVKAYLEGKLAASAV
ncbi:MAG TPA: GNAT family protein [Longimicrobiales bacterium]|nr:GNAT family protein [Longimicrobiales bacterium]